MHNSDLPKIARNRRVPVDFIKLGKVFGDKWLQELLTLTEETTDWLSIRREIAQFLVKVLVEAVPSNYPWSKHLQLISPSLTEESDLEDWRRVIWLVVSNIEVATRSDALGWATGHRYAVTGTLNYLVEWLFERNNGWFANYVPPEEQGVTDGGGATAEMNALVCATSAINAGFLLNASEDGRVLDQSVILRQMPKTYATIAAHLLRFVKYVEFRRKIRERGLSRPFEHLFVDVHGREPETTVEDWLSQMQSWSQRNRDPQLLWESCAAQVLDHSICHLVSNRTARRVVSRIAQLLGTRNNDADWLAVSKEAAASMSVFSSEIDCLAVKAAIYAANAMWNTQMAAQFANPVLSPEFVRAAWVYQDKALGAMASTQAAFVRTRFPDLRDLPDDHTFLTIQRLAFRTDQAKIVLALMLN
jgi:hypothetical protein